MMSELKMGENFSIRKWSQQKLFRELLCLCTNDYLIEKKKQKEEEEEEFHDLLCWMIWPWFRRETATVYLFIADVFLQKKTGLVANCSATIALMKSPSSLCAEDAGPRKRERERCICYREEDINTYIHVEPRLTAAITRCPTLSEGAQ